MHTRIYILRFAKEIVDQPIIYRLVKQYDLEFNILKADVSLQHEGYLVLELLGPKANVTSGLKYLKKQGVKVESLAAVINRDEEKCFQCGACTGICPTGALAIKRPEMAVVFTLDKCSGCGLCVPLCPVRAMEVTIHDNVQKVNGVG